MSNCILIFGVSKVKKIGEISSQYDISNRMLRYYEDKGTIQSFRGENNYRYYDEFSEERIKQICLLKKLDFRTKEIDQVFSASNNFELIRILYRKKMELHHQLAQLNQLSNIVNNFIALLRKSENPFFDSLELSLVDPNKIIRSDIMSKELLRIVQLPSMRVASFRAVSESPENDVHELANAFIRKNNIKSFRHFGFNNPNPTPGNPVYGYEIWITVDHDYDGVEMKTLESGLYASITTNMAEIFENWHKLFQLVEQSEEFEYHFLPPKADGTSNHQWLEEITDYEYFSNPQNDFPTKQLDLFMPITRSNR